MMYDQPIRIKPADLPLEARIWHPEGQLLWPQHPVEIENSGVRIPAELPDGLHVTLELANLVSFDALSPARLRESEHRSRNLISLALAVARQSLREYRHDPVVDAFFDRLQSLDAVARIGCEIDGEMCSVPAIVRRVTARFESPDHPQFSSSGPKISIVARWGHLIALIIHELSTNAIRHGSLSVPQGRVDVRWTVSPAENDGSVQFTFAWREQFGPRPAPNVFQGMGTGILRELVSSSPRCSSSLRLVETGAVYNLAITMSERELVVKAG